MPARGAYGHRRHLGWQRREGVSVCLYVYLCACVYVSPCVCVHVCMCVSICVCLSTRILTMTSPCLSSLSFSFLLLLLSSHLFFSRFLSCSHHMYACVCVCACVCSCVSVPFMSRCICDCSHLSLVLEFVPVSMPVAKRPPLFCIAPCVRACVRVCVRVCVGASVLGCVSGCSASCSHHIPFFQHLTHSLRSLSLPHLSHLYQTTSHR